VRAAEEARICEQLAPLFERAIWQIDLLLALVDLLQLRLAESERATQWVVH
jgi:hypothetical protein